MKALMATLRKEVMVTITCEELKSLVFKALMLPTLSYGAKYFFGGVRV
jgi:hypothetical protein